MIITFGRLFQVEGEQERIRAERVQLSEMQVVIEQHSAMRDGVKQLKEKIK